MENRNPMEYKPVFPLLMSMAIPPMISMLIQSLYNIIDSIFVSQLGEEALTAVSLIFPLQNLSLAISCGIGIAMNAFIARHLGAKDDNKASYYATQGIVMSLAHSLLFLIIGLFFIRPFLNMFTTNQNVINYGMQYGMIVVSLVIGQFIHLAIMIEPTGASRSAPLTHPCRISVCIRCMTVTVSPPPTNRTTSLSETTPERRPSAPTTGAPEMR